MASASRAGKREACCEKRKLDGLAGECLQDHASQMALLLDNSYSCFHVHGLHGERRYDGSALEGFMLCSA